MFSENEFRGRIPGETFAYQGPQSLIGGAGRVLRAALQHGCGTCGRTG